jgi:ABC-type molybdate transport system substrate-binding protein
LRVPLEEGPKISYPVAALSCSSDPDAAHAVVDFLHGDQARAIFESRGFILVSSAHGNVHQEAQR